ncbi:putative Ig [Calothrix sp. NIES-4101]|nr:putative Ig [Calothrix sp. NIES-4101]
MRNNSSADLSTTTVTNSFDISAANPLDIYKLGVTSSSNAPIVGQPLLVYDGSTQKLPNDAISAPNGPWFYYQDTTAILGGTAIPSTTNSGTKLATNNLAYAGYINYRIDSTIPTNSKLVTLNNSFPTLDPTTGYIISFTAQLESETSRIGADKNLDGKDDRAGFSVIVIGNDKKGIELGFWSDQIWAQNDGAAEPDPTKSNTLSNTLFTQGEKVDFNTKTL